FLDQEAGDHAQAGFDLPPRLVRGGGGRREADACHAGQQHDDRQQQLRADAPAHGSLFREAGRRTNQNMLTLSHTARAVTTTWTGRPIMEQSADSLKGKTAEEWFADATRWYLEGHQGCPSC